MIYEGSLSADNKKICIVVSRFNSTITQKLVSAAKDFIIRSGGNEQSIDIIYVPGAFEIGYAVKQACKKKVYDGIICLGCIIRGGTPHFEYLASQSTAAAAQLSLEFNIPISNGILTVENMEQALERSGIKMGNKGWEAASALIELINVSRAFNA